MKLENVLIGADGHSVLSDFGIVSTNRDSAWSFCGTAGYLAPEILFKMEYSYEVDVWAWGVCLFEMAEGFSPFQGKKDLVLFDEIKYRVPRFLYAKFITEELRALLEGVLNKEPAYRSTIKAVKKHPWYVENLGDDKVQQVFLGLHPSVLPKMQQNGCNYLVNFPSDVIEEKFVLDNSHIRSMNEIEDKVFEKFNWRSQFILK